MNLLSKRMHMEMSLLCAILDRSDVLILLKIEKEGPLRCRCCRSSAVSQDNSYGGNAIPKH